MLGKGSKNDTEEVFARVVSDPQNHDADVSARRVFAHIRKVEILGDQKTLFCRAGIPDLFVGFARKALVENAVNIVPEAAQAALQGKRKILIKFDPHAAAAGKTGRSSRAEAAA